MTSLQARQAATLLHIEVMRAYAKGKTIQLQAGSGQWVDTDTPSWDWCRCNYRIKPSEPKLRPWEPEEVPVGALIKTREGRRWTITSCDADNIYSFDYSPCHWSFRDASIHINYSLDSGKTWLPCGVYESQ